jgi:hypothetical protein
MTDDELRSVMERIAARTRSDADGSDCKWWAGAHDKAMPITSISGKSVGVRRVLVALAHGLTLEDPWIATSTCNHAECINPAHLMPKDRPERAPTTLPEHATVQERDKWIANKRKLSLKDDYVLTEDEVRVIRRHDGSLSQIEAEFGVHRTTASSIRNRRSWAWVPDDPADALSEPLFIDVGVPMSALDRQTAAVVLQIDAHSYHCGHCIVTDLPFDPRDNRPLTTLHGRKETVARVLCAIKHDKRLWAAHEWHARHLCGNAACVNPNHLAPGTQVENEADKLRHGTRVRGEKSGRSTLIEQQVRWLIDTADTVPTADAAERVGCSEAHARAVRRGDVWAHLT